MSTPTFNADFFAGLIRELQEDPETHARLLVLVREATHPSYQQALRDFQRITRSPERVS